jgi:hypothetical protein
MHALGCNYEQFAADSRVAFQKGSMRGFTIASLAALCFLSAYGSEGPDGPIGWLAVAPRTCPDAQSGELRLAELTCHHPARRRR